MSKKDFKGGLDSLLENSKEKPPAIDRRGRPKTNFKEVTKTSQEGTKAGETRATFIVIETLLEKCKALAYWDRTSIKNVINTALQDYLNKYETKNGIIKGIPERTL